MQRPSAPCVQIKSIRQAVNLILDHIENDLGLESIAIPADKQYYWDMGIDEKFVITDTSPSLTIGKVSDDLEFVSLMVKNAEGDSSQAPGLMLMHIAPVLAMLGSIVKS